MLYCFFALIQGGYTPYQALTICLYYTLKSYYTGAPFPFQPPTPQPLPPAPQPTPNNIWTGLTWDGTPPPQPPAPTTTTPPQGIWANPQSCAIPFPPAPMYQIAYPNSPPELVDCFEKLNSAGVTEPYDSLRTCREIYLGQPTYLSPDRVQCLREWISLGKTVNEARALCCPESVDMSNDQVYY